ncbi:type I restriction enzyme, S subunit [Enhydrobacter aerosaccus]|uniref:Type I restriction enzyme, S subunit n=1 Tax=Enhydrobacter aerosaccus TaxID=225324 RepID=A0A1T4QML7_9HYPH|nr:restriction endonuclease subunit S [Enhydrobacter aerosaccus]SKA04867.1 type I restriction enzyme, S subunit [Enhydrobacter aerosaccus]
MSFQRYPKYKDSGTPWLSHVPEHWEIVQFKQLVEVQNGVDHKHVEQADGYPVFGSGGPFTYASDFLYDGESVLLGRKGTIDKPLHVIGRFWTVDTMYWTKICPGTYGRFAFYAALVIPFDFYSTNTALPSMTKSVLSSHLLARPPLAEQIHIAAFLDRETEKIDELVAEQQRLIELLKEKRQAVISHAVTKGLNPAVRMKPSGIEWLGDVPAHWAVKRLRHISPEITVGIVVEPSKYYTDEGVPALRSLNIRPGAMKLENLVFISESANELHKKSQLRAGDLVAVRSGQPGTTAIVPKELDGCNCIDLIIVRKPAIDSEKFLCWYLASDAAVMQFSVGSDGAIQQHFNVGTAMNLVVSMPTPAEQEQIVDFIDREASKLDSLVAEAQHAIGLLQERRTALISAAVTGQIDVRGLAERKAA